MVSMNIRIFWTEMGWVVNDFLFLKGTITMHIKVPIFQMQAEFICLKKDSSAILTKIIK